jgi:hypothetical protein
LIKKHPEFVACISNEAKPKVFLCRQEEDDKKMALLAGMGFPLKYAETCAYHDMDGKPGLHC